ncbi:MAG: ABC transporter ATP-binding protein [Proteobacteria bacterium]|nr:ABC transporter ATP-binding protein [Pseudomonadota bacterium]
MLEVKDLSSFYGSLRALEDISLKVESGQIVSIIGANGAGKSTLLKSISGLMRNKTGSVLFKNKDISALPANTIVGSGISHVLEGRQLFASLTTRDNLNLGAFLYHKRKNASLIRKRLDDVFQIFPILKDRAHQYAGTLSGGEQQMLAIARALMARPQLLLLDEPSLGLAPKIVQDIFSVVQDLNRQGTTILLVEQNAKLALGISNYAYVLETGKVGLEGTGNELLSNDSVRKAYLGSS